MKKVVFILTISLMSLAAQASTHGQLNKGEPLITSKMTNWVNKHLTYPENAIENKTEGTVYVGFSLNSEGQLEDVKVVQGVSEELDQEALNVFNEMPIADLLISIPYSTIDYILPIKFAIK